MKFYNKIIVVIVVSVMSSTVYSADLVKKAIWGSEPETCAELIQKGQKPIEVIRSEDIKNDHLAGLLDQAIPTGKLELYNPSNIINQTIKL
ncbi:MAG TPA: hypothetical protein VNJ29_03465, partial [Candidatus Nitrosotenuis sp.]|nr:hypothetical protein [Candidatus Nitrosotenuis sp.]